MTGEQASEGRLAIVCERVSLVSAAALLSSTQPAKCCSLWEQEGWLERKGIQKFPCSHLAEDACTPATAEESIPIHPACHPNTLWYIWYVHMSAVHYPGRTGTLIWTL